VRLFDISTEFGEKLISWHRMSSGKQTGAIYIKL